MFRNQIRSAAALALALALGVAAGASGLAAPGPQGPAPAPTARPAGDVATQARLRAQRFATRKARIAADMARLGRDLADLAVREYEEATYPNDLASAEEQLALARSDLARAEVRAEWARTMNSKPYFSEQLKLDEQARAERARSDLEQAQAHLDVLVKSTRDRTLRTLRARAAQAEADRSAREADWEQERAREARLVGPPGPA